MKSYSLELVQRKTGAGALGKMVTLAAIGIGVYAGYRRLTDTKKTNEFKDGIKENTFDAAAHEGENFTARVLKAAKRAIS